MTCPSHNLECSQALERGKPSSCGESSEVPSGANARIRREISWRTNRCEGIEGRERVLAGPLIRSLPFCSLLDSQLSM